MGTDIEDFQEFLRNLSNPSPEKEPLIPGIILKPPNIYTHYNTSRKKSWGKIRFKVLNYFPTNFDWERMNSSKLCVNEEIIPLTPHSEKLFTIFFLKNNFFCTTSILSSKF